MLLLAALGISFVVGTVVLSSDDDEMNDVSRIDDGSEANGSGSETETETETEVAPETETNDPFYGEAENDMVTGGDANDTLYGGAGDDTLTGGAGDDGLDGEDGNDSLAGGSDDDVLQGGYGNDVLSGGSGNDFLQGESNDDTLNGGMGDDGLHGGNGSDQLNGGAGNDLLNGASLDVDDQLLEDWLGDFSAGQSPADLGNENTAIVDDYIGDFLNGGDGDDTLIGSAFDVLTGGEGEDAFVAGDWSTSGFAATVTDFDTGEDVIVYRYDETGSEPDVSANTIVNGDGTTDVQIQANGVTVLFLQNVGSDFDIATHVSLVAAPMAATAS